MKVIITHAVGVKGKHYAADLNKEVEVDKGDGRYLTAHGKAVDTADKKGMEVIKLMRKARAEAKEKAEAEAKEKAS